MKQRNMLLLAVALVGGLGLTVWAINKKQQIAPEIPSQKTEGSDFTKSPESILYRIETQGQGQKPQRGQRVEVHYTGWLDVNGKEGTKFDSSVDRGRPFDFRVGAGQVIRGWDIAVADMKQGEIRYIILPPDLAYGPRGMGPIPPQATLRFKIELLKVG